MTKRHVLLAGLSTLLLVTFISVMTSSPQTSMQHASEDGTVEIVSRSSTSRYRAPEGWVLEEELSTPSMTVFVPQGTEDASEADTLVIEHAMSNFASAGNPSGFYSYLFKSLKPKASAAGYELVGRVTTTATGLPLLHFEFARQDSPTLYFSYVVGNGEYVRIEGLAQTQDAIIEDAVSEVASSFSWR